MMMLHKGLTIALLSLGALGLGALPSLARPASIDYEANVRTEPSMYSDRIDGLPKGTPLEVLKVVPDTDSTTQSYWYYVRSTGKLRTEGWVTSSLVRFQPSSEEYGTLRGDVDDRINIRSGPGLNAKVLHTGVMGDLVQVGNRRRFEPTANRPGVTWYQVTFSNGATGWVREDLITIWPPRCIITCPDI